MKKYTTINRNGKVNHEDNGQFAITTATLKTQKQAERRQREQELKAELGGWAASMGISEDELAGLFA